MLYKLLAHWPSAADEVSVISLTDKGPVGEKIRNIGVPVTALGMRRGRPDPCAVLRLAALLRKSRPDLVQTWMYHADLLGGLAARLAGRIPVVWGVRQSNLDAVHSKRMTIWTARVCGLLSRWLPDRIISCSNTARNIHEGLGYSSTKLVVIPNGFDMDVFHPDAEARAGVRKELGISENTMTVGIVARYDPQKDHRTFFRAAGRVRRRINSVAFVLCGTGIDESNATLSQWVQEESIRDCSYLLGERTDVARLLAALDVSVLSSAYGEGFPNAVGEAMCSGVPCVCTDVGDTAEIVGGTGIIVPPGDVDGLAEGVLTLLAEGNDAHTARGAAARSRIAEMYSIERIVELYRDLYNGVIRAPIGTGG